MNLQLLYSDAMQEIVRLTLDIKNRIPDAFTTVEDSMTFLSNVKSEDDLMNYASALRNRLAGFGHTMMNHA